MPSHDFRVGDPCYLDAIVCNATAQQLTDHPLFVVLDVFGEYWFAPSWIKITEGIDFFDLDFSIGITNVEVIPLFSWPPDTGSQSGIFFWGAMTNPERTEIFGELDNWEFGWAT